VKGWVRKTCVLLKYTGAHEYGWCSSDRDQRHIAQKKRSSQLLRRSITIFICNLYVYTVCSGSYFISEYMP
jgi:hypothetical protein